MILAEERGLSELSVMRSLLRKVPSSLPTLFRERRAQFYEKMEQWVLRIGEKLVVFYTRFTGEISLFFECGKSGFLRIVFYTKGGG